MNDHEILALYTQAYNRARQTGGGGRETPHQIAHCAGLQAIFAMGGGESGIIETQEVPLRLQPEDPAVAHQRRLGFASHWLDQDGRRKRISANPTFTNVTDAFAAGGAYERAYLAGESRAEELIGPMMTNIENAVHKKLETASGMAALLADLHEVVGVADPVALVERIIYLVQNAPPMEEVEPEEEQMPVGTYFSDDLDRYVKPGEPEWSKAAYERKSGDIWEEPAAE